MYLKNILNNFISILKWRGMLQDSTPELESHLQKNKSTAYIGFDPTSDSLHIGSLVQLVLLRHFQKQGHKPIVLVGGATGRIGDPSGKAKERNLLDEETLNHNVSKIKEQIGRFLDFDDTNPQSAVLLDNYTWLKKFSLIDFSREIGKHITVNYMMAKESVKKRIASDESTGMSFTEFTYQLLQGYDFLHLFNEQNCVLQMGGSDQWGNITTGIELIRRKTGKKAFGLTCPLIVKSDGTKFGKTESGNVWLDRKKTSPYKFYQYWLNVSDADAENYIKIFTFLEKEVIEDLIKEHQQAPHLRLLQKTIAKELMLLVHSKKDLDAVEKASHILFGKATSKELAEIDKDLFLEIFEGVPQTTISRDQLQSGVNIVEALAGEGFAFLKSKGEARRALKENAISVNKEKVKEEHSLTEKDLINDAYILLQRGKKAHYLIIVK